MADDHAALAAFPAAADAALLGAFAALLHRYLRQSEIELGVGADRILLTISPDSTLRSLAAAVAREPAARPLPIGAAVATATATERPFEVELVVPSPLADTLELHYDGRLFDEATAQRLLTHYRALLRDGLARPDRPVAGLAMLSAEEEHQILVEWNATTTLLHASACLHEAFEDQARRCPDAVAAIQGPTRLTYREVDTEANRLAHRLRELGVGPEVRVGLLLDPGTELLIAMLAVLKAGGAYLPLDSAHPPARLDAMVNGAACAVLIGRGSTLTGPAIPLDPADPAIAARPSEPPSSGVTPANLCYVMHTSGSTGVPKAIAVGHRGVMNNIADLNARFAVGSGDTVLALSAPSFDMSVYELLGTTIAGGTVVFPDPGRHRDPAHWAELASAHGVTVWHTAPALLELLLEHLDRHGTRPLGTLRLVMLAGDWIPLGLPARVREHAPGHRFVSLGGATEASIYSTIYEVAATDPAWRSIPYGRPMANQRTYLLDEERRPLPPGVPGELYLAGVGLARGYLGQPELTAERFVDWSYGPVTGERLYRTGDLARYGSDGVLELLGRVDRQVKLSGLRIELPEVEAALQDHPEVRDAVVTVRDRGLVGYVVPRAGTTPSAERLRDHLAARLPAAMVPGAVLLLAELPLNPHGKVDRAALPDPRATAPEGTSPAGHWEKRIAKVWRELLGVEVIRRGDSFFALGGTSMHALRAMIIDPALDWKDVYRHPTLHELARHLEAAAGEPKAP